MVKNLIYTKRKELGLTLEEIARVVGVSKGTVAKWESGYIENMKRDKIALLSEVLRLSPIELINMGTNKLVLKKHIPTIEEKIKIDQERIELEILNRLSSYLERLNSDGQAEAFKRIEELTQLSKYTEKE